MSKSTEILGESHGIILIEVTTVVGTPPVSTVSYEVHGPGGLIFEDVGWKAAVEAFILAVDSASPGAGAAARKKLRR